MAETAKNFLCEIRLMTVINNIEPKLEPAEIVTMYHIGTWSRTLIDVLAMSFGIGLPLGKTISQLGVRASPSEPDLKHKEGVSVDLSDARRQEATREE